jgi:hypothetical protein
MMAVYRWGPYRSASLRLSRASGPRGADIRVAKAECFVFDGECRTLPRSGYIEQPRALALGQVAIKGAMKVAPDMVE